MLNYDNLFIFVEVAKHGSFIEASKHLNMPSSTVSRRISQLESNIKIRLLERNSRKIHLTEKGALLFSECSAPIQLLSQKIQNIASQHHQSKGKIVVTAPVLLGNEILNQWFFDFLNTHKKIELDIILTNQYQDILTEQIDVAIRIGPLKDSQFIAQYLFSSKFILCASQKYINQSLLNITPFNNWHEKHLLLLQQHANKIEMTHQITKEKKQFNIKAKLHSNDITVIRSAALNNIGIAYLPKLTVNAQLQSGELVEILSDYIPSLKKDIFAVYPSKKHLSHKTRLFLDYIKERSIAMKK